MNWYMYPVIYEGIENTWLLNIWWHLIKCILCLADPNGDETAVTSLTTDTTNANGTVTQESQVTLPMSRDLLGAMVKVKATIEGSDYEAEVEQVLYVNGNHCGVFFNSRIYPT